MENSLVQMYQGVSCKRLICSRLSSALKLVGPLVGDGLWMRINYVFTPQEEGEEADTATFSWSTDGKEWITADYKLPMRFTLDYFTGYRSALYHFNTLGEGGIADFDWFHQWTY